MSAHWDFLCPRCGFKNHGRGKIKYVLAPCGEEHATDGHAEWVKADKKAQLAWEKARSSK